MPSDAQPLAEDRGPRVWATPEWRQAALAWAEAALSAAGIHRTGEATQPRIRAWATVLRIPTTAGIVWMKAAAHETAAEVPLYGLLTRVAPAQVLHPLAADPERGWILLPDGGGSLADELDGIDLPTVLERILPEYGALQVALAPHADEMLALGVADMRPHRMPERFDEAAGAVREGLETADRPRYERALAFRGAYARWAERLAASAVPASLDHNDLHAANMLVPHADEAVATRFYDWGDAVVAHPFASMLHGLGWVAFRLGTTDDDPLLHRLRDAYLGPFEPFAPHARLIEDFELACRVAKVGRCLTWARAIAMRDEGLGYERAPFELFAGIPEPGLFSPV
ncbi:phosphotransferase [Naasia aerilata]|uniref:Phosphotransferase n=1 Tax=Naasia aerilata TaxID=1162966 RepID=A0ABM8GEL3_9MICO|nr:phosphotransferase [Naasia aerilata]BDZ46748.1 phosphotransferase [Naasia aerilata]